LPICLPNCAAKNPSQFKRLGLWRFLMTKAWAEGEPSKTPFRDTPGASSLRLSSNLRPLGRLLWL
jgi:hypothetical protein